MIGLCTDGKKIYSFNINNRCQLLFGGLLALWGFFIVKGKGVWLLASTPVCSLEAGGVSGSGVCGSGLSSPRCPVPLASMAMAGSCGWWHGGDAVPWAARVAVPATSCVPLTCPAWSTSISKFCFLPCSPWKEFIEDCLKQILLCNNSCPCRVQPGSQGLLLGRRTEGGS